MNKHDFDWFDLDNYSGLNDLDLLGWQTQIIIRERGLKQVSFKF